MLIGYARVSTTDQNMALQLDALTDAGCGPVFTETASGAQRTRPQLDCALAALSPGDTLVVWRLDRLARSLRQLIDTVDQLQARQVGLRSLTEVIDTTTPTGRLVFHVFGAIAEFERSVIREQTMAGLVAARARGRRGGRPAALNGEAVREARRLLSSRSVEDIASILNVAPSTVYRHLQDAGR